MRLKFPKFPVYEYLATPETIHRFIDRHGEKLRHPDGTWVDIASPIAKEAEASVLYEIAANYHSPSVQGYCLEIGVETGASSALIAEALNLNPGLDRLVFSVDIMFHPESFERWSRLGLHDKICYILEDEQRFIQRWHLPTRMIFIDSSHTYESVCYLFPIAMQKLEPGGWLVFHDYVDHHPGVVQAVNEFLDDCPQLFDFSKIFLDRTLLTIQKPLI